MTTINYTHIQVSDNGVGKPINPNGYLDPSLSDNFDDEDLIDAVWHKRWQDWQSQHSHLTFTCLDADGNFVKPGRYRVDDFGEPVHEALFANVWVKAPFGGDEAVIAHFKHHKTITDSRVALYLKAQEVKEETECHHVYTKEMPNGALSAGTSCIKCGEIHPMMSIIKANLTPPTEIPAIATSEGIEKAAEKYAYHKHVTKGLHDSDTNDFEKGMEQITVRERLISQIDFEAGANHLIQQGWKEVKLLKLIRISKEPENYNWYNGLIGLKTPEGYIPMHVNSRHKLFWQKEFGLTDEYFDAIESPQF